MIIFSLFSANSVYRSKIEEKLREYDSKNNPRKGYTVQGYLLQLVNIAGGKEEVIYNKKVSDKWFP